MASRIEDYALIGDCETAALVSKDGSIDWLCVPRFDSPAQGRWLLTPAGDRHEVRRHYREGTLVLETEYESESGAVTVVDFMPPRTAAPDVARLVEGKRGEVLMRMELVIRFDYGSAIPWVRRTEDGLSAVAGPHALRLRTPVKLRGEDFRTVAEFPVSPGQRVPFALAWYPSHQTEPPEVDVEAQLRDTENWWAQWSARCTYDGEWRDAVLRSLLTLKALCYTPTGGLVAAPTTSLP